MKLQAPVTDAKKPRGLLITFEGTDGSGKTTQARILAETLRERGYTVRTYKFPTTGISGKLAYAYLNSEINSEALNGYQAASLYLVDMVCYTNEINTAIENGEIVIVDRYVGSNFYQQAARSLNLDSFSFVMDLKKFIQEIRTMAYNIMGIRRPDITFFMEVSSRFSKQIREKDKTRVTKDFHEKDEDYLTKVARTAVLAASIDKWRSIDCDYRTIEEISNDILTVFDKEVFRLGKYFNPVQNITSSEEN